MDITWFMVGLVAGAAITYFIMQARHDWYERENGRRQLELLFEQEVAKRTLNYVVVLPPQEWQGGYHVSPLREPKEAVIDDNRYHEGDKLTRELIIDYMSDEGATRPFSGDPRLVPTEPDVRIEEIVFHNASLIDEWHVLIRVSPDHPRYKEWRLEALSFRLVTDQARYQDGSDASLASHSASYVDGTPITLPREKDSEDPDQGGYFTDLLHDFDDDEPDRSQAAQDR